MSKPKDREALLNLMVHRLEAQERTAYRMKERAAAHAVFSFAILGIYTGVLFASSEAPSNLLLGGAAFLAAMFLATFIVFLLIHRPGTRLTLPDPREVSKQKSIKHFPDAIIEAFEVNSRSVWASQTMNTVLLVFVGIQVLAFLAITLGELFTR